MRGVRFAAWIAALTLLGTGSALAAECDGISFPDQAVVDGSPLSLNGLGLRLATMLKVKVYVAGLYVASPAKNAQAILGASTPKRLVLHFVRDVDAGELSEAWDDGFEHNAKSQLPALRSRVEKLKSSMSDMKSGELLVFTIRPAAGVEVDVNGRVAGRIEGDDFSKAFLSIWLGEHPPNPGLKTGLLGGRCD
jgi:hypothetical protein